MRNVKLILGLVLAIGMLLPVLAQSWKAGDKAPAFSGAASDGRTYSLATVRTTRRPTVLYFIGHTCPVNAQAVRFYNRVATAYRGRVNFIGVIDTDRAGYQTWQRRFSAPFPVIFDPQMKIIKAYKAQRSPWTIMFDARGNITHEWPGYSIGEINELSAAIARAANVPVARIDTTGAPERPRFG